MTDKENVTQQSETLPLDDKALEKYVHPNYTYHGLY